MTRFCVPSRFRVGDRVDNWKVERGVLSTLVPSIQGIWMVLRLQKHPDDFPVRTLVSGFEILRWLDVQAAVVGGRKCQARRFAKHLHLNT